ncbi:hypothetical protein Bca101_071224 [Brassica carinata]
MGVYLVLLDEKDTYAEKAHERPLPGFLDELMGRTISHITNTNKSSLNLITKVRKQYSKPLSPTQRPAAFIRLSGLLPAFQATPLASTDNMNTCNTALYTFSFIKLEPDGAGQTSNTRTTRQKSSFMKTCLIHNKPGAQYIVGMEGYFLYKNIDKAQSMT